MVCVICVVCGVRTWVLVHNTSTHIDSYIFIHIHTFPSSSLLSPSVVSFPAFLRPSFFLPPPWTLHFINLFYMDLKPLKGLYSCGGWYRWYPISPSRPTQKAPPRRWVTKYVQLPIDVHFLATVLTTCTVLTTLTLPPSPFLLPLGCAKIKGDLSVIGYRRPPSRHDHLLWTTSGTVEKVRVNRPVKVS